MSQAEVIYRLLMDSAIIILSVILTLFVVEIIFRKYYNNKHGRNYHVSIKFPWTESHVIPHPFLSLSYRRNSYIDRNQRLPYPIHTNKYYSFKQPLRINNLGHFGKDFSVNKPDGTLRIACLGHSSTANNIADESRDYSYPEFIESYLKKELSRYKPTKNVEVYNCGIGGWISIDIMIDFLLNIIHTKPDYIILYYGYNDLYFQLNDNFELDYSHNRKNLGEVMRVIRRGYYFPKIKFWHSYECLKDKLFGSGNVRNEVLRHINISKPKADRDFSNLEVEMNILRNILIVCKYYDIKIILSSFVYYDHEKTPMTKKFSEGVKLENELLRSLAEEFNAVFVDAAELIPLNDELFVDCVHFTPKGMELIAKCFAEAVISDLDTKNKYKDEILLHR